MPFKSIDMGGGHKGSGDFAAILQAPEFAMVLDRMTDGVLVLDAESRLRAFNNTALHMINPGSADIAGMALDELVNVGTLDWAEHLQQSGGQRRREFIAASRDGRSILMSIRYLRDAAGKTSLTLVFMRDLQVFDHLRRTAAGDNGGNVFKFLADRDIGPDYEAQRQLSVEVEQMVARGTRALRQGARLLLVGESGSGKTELAKYLHRAVGTPEEAFIQVNCGAIPESLFESEMFGYEKGAFTGALQSGKHGLIEAAEGGTLFLDEIGEIPLASQAKLLKFLEDGVVQRIGGRSGKKINTRIITATNRDLWQQVTEKRFRNDLYYRLAVITLKVTPLREQPIIIRHLIDHFVAAANRMRKPQLRISGGCRSLLLGHSYPGNIRELHNLIQHLSVAAEDEALPEHLPAYVRQQSQNSLAVGQEAGQAPAALMTGETGEEALLPLKEQVRAFERALIDRAIERLGSKRKAARALGVDIGTIVRKTQEGHPEK